jgi:hypothetical protein
MISSEEMDGLGVFDFHAKQKRDNFYTELSPVDKVPHEQIR